MQYCLAVFKSRNETLFLANLLLNKGYNVGVVNTPREVGQACGISVKFNENLLQTVRQVLQSKPFRSFYGFVQVSHQGGRVSIIKL